LDDVAFLGHVYFPKIFKISCHIKNFGHMHGVLNVVKENNQLHSLAVNDEMNLLSLTNP